jgi:hypothetical protein
MNINKIVLFVTLGNRDLQIPPDAKLPLNFFKAHFDEGSEDSGSNYVVKKNDQQFIYHSESIWNSFEDCKSQVTFPMVEKCLDLIPRPDEIVIITTKQNPFNSQDCHFVALFLEKWLNEKGYFVKYRPIEFPPIDFEKLVEYYSGLFEEYSSGYEMYFGNSGGTPDMRTASNFAGMFKGINFITIPAKQSSNDKNLFVKNYREQEKLVLKHIVENMLSNFDFSGLLSLPIDEKSKDYAHYALARIAFDFDTAKYYAGKLMDPDLKIPDIENIKILETEMLQSARIKFHQKSFADYLWRLFTIMENLLIPYVESLMNGKIVHNKKNNHQDWNNLISNIPKLREFLEQQKIGDAPLNFAEPNIYAYSKILKFFENEDKWSKPDLLVRIQKNLENLRSLRNSIAHNYDGISLEKINSQLVKSTFLNMETSADNFNKMLCSYCEIKFDSHGIYSQIIQKIKSEL